MAGDISAWTPQIRHFRDRFRVIAFDNRGAGRSTQRDEPVTTVEMAGDTIGLLDHLGVTDAHIVGRSMGGAIAQHVTLERPDLVRTLVTCASFAKLDPIGQRALNNMKEVLEWTGSWAAHARHSVQNFVGYRFFNERQETVQRIEQLIGGESRLHACYVQQNLACFSHDTLAQLPQISRPTLVLAGSNDIICSPTTTRWLSEGIPDAETVMFDECGHFFLIEQEERFLVTLDRWFTQHSDPESALARGFE